MRRGKHARSDGGGFAKKLLWGLVALLTAVQLLMLNDGVRGRLSTVDALEGQSAEFEKKINFPEGL